jgi:hypothetical protein
LILYRQLYIFMDHHGIPDYVVHLFYRYLFKTILIVGFISSHSVPGIQLFAFITSCSLELFDLMFSNYKIKISMGWMKIVLVIRMIGLLFNCAFLDASVNTKIPAYFNIVSQMLVVSILILLLFKCSNKYMAVQQEINEVDSWDSSVSDNY